MRPMTIPTLPPSTDWKEVVAADEPQRFAAYARQIGAMQAAKSKKFGTGRALHRKQVGAAQGTLQVLGDLPPFAAQGLFAKPGQWDVWVRLSNGGADVEPDHKPDIRGFALRVLGVKGESALGNGDASSQDFALINQETFGFANSAQFVGFLGAFTQSPAALIKYLVRTHGLLGGPARLVQMLKALTQPFGGFAAQAMHSAAPIACGPYAVKVRLLPHASNGAPVKKAQSSWNAEFAARLSQQDLQWDLQLQPYVSEELTPIEDASVTWPTTYTSVARLTLPRQEMAGARAGKLAEKIEAATFDPWQALAAHRPLGDVMRARKVVYFESQKARGAG